jgi:hypothetical protein
MNERSGWGDISLHIHPTPSPISLRSMRADPPPPGEGKENLRSPIQSSTPPPGSSFADAHDDPPSPRFAGEGSSTLSGLIFIPPPCGKGRRVAPGWGFSRCTSAFPRRESARVLQETRPSKDRGRGECRVPGRTHSLACKNKKHTSFIHHGYTGATRHSLRDGFNGYSALSLVNRAFLPPSSLKKRELPGNLTPASGRQDHAFWPSAAASFVSRRRSRPPHPAPNVRDDREAPLFSGAGRRERWN